MANLTIPIPLHQSSIQAGASLIEQLILELQTESGRNQSLRQKLMDEQKKTRRLEEALSALAKPKLPRNESWMSMASTAAEEDEHPVTGTYSPFTRKQKILRYKEKVQKYRVRVRLTRRFSGRSTVAKSKPRLNGKFIKLNNL